MLRLSWILATLIIPLTAGIMVLVVTIPRQIPGGVVVYSVSDRVCTPDTAVMVQYFNFGQALEARTLIPGSNWCRIETYEPACAPDGRRVAVSTNFMSDSNRFGETFRLFVKDIYQSEAQIMTAENAGDLYAPAWSPDGEQLVFAKRSDADGIAVAIADAGDADVTNWQSFVTSERFYAPNWSPKGDTIVFESSGAVTTAAYLMNPDGSDMRLFTDNAQFPRFSPDGEHIAFIRRDTDTRSSAAYLQRIGDDAVQQLTPDDMNITFVDWSPDGQHLAVIAEVERQRDIFVITLETGKTMRLTDDAYPEGSLCWLR